MSNILRKFCSQFTNVFGFFFEIMDSYFLSWGEPIVRSTTKIRNDDELLSWDRPVPVKEEQDDEVPRASFLSWDAPTPKSIRIEKFQSGKGNGNADVNSNKLTGMINSSSKRIHSLAIFFASTNSVI